MVRAAYRTRNQAQGSVCLRTLWVLKAAGKRVISTRTPKPSDFNSPAKNERNDDISPLAVTQTVHSQN